MTYLWMMLRLSCPSMSQPAWGQAMLRPPLATMTPPTPMTMQAAAKHHPRRNKASVQIVQRQTRRDCEHLVKLDRTSFFPSFLFSFRIAVIQQHARHCLSKRTLPCSHTSLALYLSCVCQSAG
eukprot:scpid38870/ scgid18089/ 